MYSGVQSLVYVTLGYELETYIIFLIYLHLIIPCH
jgi:hypothetical protein